MAQRYLLTDDQLKRIGRAVRAVEHGLGRRVGVSSDGAEASGTLLNVALLLTDLAGEGSAPAILMEREESLPVQVLTALGRALEYRFAVGVRLGGQTEWTSDLPPYCTAEQLQAALLAVPSLHDGDVEVLGGRITYEERTYDLRRWYLRWGAQLAGRGLPSLEFRFAYGDEPSTGPASSLAINPIVAASTKWWPKWDLVDVHCPLPGPAQTPLRAGCLVLAGFVAGVGLSVVSAEPRDYFYANPAPPTEEP